MRLAARLSRALGALALALAAPAPGSAAAGLDAPALRLRADFDAGTADAGFAAGDRRASRRLPLEQVPGVGGRGGALLPRPDAECAYAASGNFDLRAGTLSFWARAHDWRDGGGGYRVLFEASAQVDGVPFSFFVDTAPEPDLVRLVLMRGVGGDPRQLVLQITAPVKWRAGWQKVDVTWDEREIAIFGNGEVGERLPLHTLVLPALADATLRLVPLRGGPGSGRTLLDELEIWSAPLPPDRIRRRFQAQRATPLEPPRLRAPRWSGAPPRPDGRLDEPGWQRAMRVPLLTDAETGFAGLLIPSASLAWSDDALWVGIEAPSTVAGGEPGPGDAFELTLARDGAGARRWRVAATGVEALDGAPPAQGGARVEAGRFGAELRLPFEALGAGRAAPEQALGLDLRHLPVRPGALFAPAALALRGGPDGLARLTLGAEPDGARWQIGWDAASGRAALGVERETEAELEASLAAPDAKPRPQHSRIRGRGELALEGLTGTGVLRAALRDAASGAELAQLSSRVGPLEPPGLLPVPEPEGRKLAVELDLRWLDGSWQSALASGEARAELEDIGPDGGAGPRALRLSGGRARVELASGLAPGRHRLALRLRRTEPAGSLSLVRELRVPPLRWLGNQVGQGERVPEPWEPVTPEGDSAVRVWGRRYRLDGPLLAGVEGRGGEMLRAPMQLRARGSAGNATLRVLERELESRSDARIGWHGRAELAGAGLDVRWSSSVEYDGLVLASFTLEPRRPGLRIDELVLEIPLAPRLARFLRGTQDGALIRAGRVPWDGKRFESRFEPFVWLSNEEEGFLYFAESSANWVGAERSGAVVVRGGAEASIALRLIGEPVSLPGPLRYELGFQATPVKPLPADARSWNFGAVSQPLPRERAVAYYAGYAVADGLFALRRPDAVRRRGEELRAAGSDVLYFGATSATPDFLPTYRLFAPLWRSGWSASWGAQALPESSLAGAVPAHRLTGVCPGDPAFQDRMLHDALRLLRETGGLGVYTDTDDVVIDDNPRHGCGFTDAFGRHGVSWTILNKRRFARRLATLLRDVEGERHYWMSHALSRLVPPVHGFADFFYPGEELTGLVAQDPFAYLDRVDEAAWRAEYRGDASGIVHVFLPELSRGNGRRQDVDDPRPTESLLAMAAVNDVNVSSPYANPRAIAEYWELRQRLLLIEAEFVGHWRPDCPVRSSERDARVSLYRTRRGPVIAVANRAREERRIELELDRAALGLGERIAARDERAQALLAANRDRLALSLPGRSWTFVSLRNE